MNLRPLHDQVVLKRTDPDVVSAGGIIIPGNVAEKPDQGTVVAVGPGKKEKGGFRAPLSVKAGDVVIFGFNSGHPIKVNGEDFIVMKEEEIFAVVE